ncbi:hypothetical protein CYMTET_4340, partial [Cymbomonas tetramitiformis]
DIDSDGDCDSEFDEGAPEEDTTVLAEESADDCTLETPSSNFKFNWSKEHEEVSTDQRVKDGVGTETCNPKLRWDNSWVKVGRKPDSKGHELKTLACGISKVLFRFELQEGKIPDNLKKYVDRYGATTALVLRMLEGLKGVGYILIADSWFGSTKTCILLLAWGIYSVLNVKTAYRLFPKTQLMEALKPKGKGEHVCYQADVKMSATRSKTIFAVGHKGPGKMSKAHQKSTGWGADAVGVPLLLDAPITLSGRDSSASGCDQPRPPSKEHVPVTTEEHGHAHPIVVRKMKVVRKTEVYASLSAAQRDIASGVALVVEPTQQKRRVGRPAGRKSKRARNVSVANIESAPEATEDAELENAALALVALPNI